MAGLFADFLTNKIFLSVFFAYFLGGIIKIMFYFLGSGKLDIRVFFRTGGMPSTHTASVTAMTSAIYLYEGVSNLFVVCFIMSLVIIADAIGIRRAAGKQAQILNTMVEEFTYFKKFKTKRLYELLGHTPKQAIAGIFLGILVAIMVFRF
jgi:uncharacterized protein